MTIVTGGCLCGYIRYECNGEPLTSVKCHCRDCQKAHGAPFAALVCMPPNCIKLVKGSTAKHEDTADSGSGNFKEFCPKCGTHLFSGGADFPELRTIKLATLDDPDKYPPVAHVWAKSAVSWAGTNDGLPVFSGQPEMSEIESLWQKRAQENV